MKLNKLAFTLVEVLISIAVFGIVITPISYLFINSMKSTMVADRQLQANQIAQEYVEKVKAMSYSELSPGFFNATGKTFSVDSKYDVVVKMEKFSGNPYEIPIENSDSTYDSIIYILKVSLKDKAGNEIVNIQTTKLAE